MEIRLANRYKELAPKLMSDLGLDNVMEIPRIQKVVINAGIGNIKDNREHIEAFEHDLSVIAGQKVSVRKARLSEAGFNLRKGANVGLTVTLRNQSMWTFLDKLINIALPRVRDFSGVSTTSFDAFGNYSLGILEHTIFPEVNPNVVKSIRGLQITVVVRAKNSAHSKALLQELGMPFRKDSKING
ncbi:MAG: 50S ribosomal protein L5 [Patescibacteria group bacterium]|uniref:Large ribosomal subunit protein uL5 n=1 Tax=candidate division WWE3 bacterium TaxID=2053526 RepID=A0A955J1X0_UNCKA|nr:50S ribosomal protein L5 [candidate division WWE3 bacterium]